MVIVLTVCYYVCYYYCCMSRTRFRSESTLYSCLNVKELLARNRCDIWSFTWQQGDLNSQPLSSQTNTQPFSELAELSYMPINVLAFNWIMFVNQITKTTKRNPKRAMLAGTAHNKPIPNKCLKESPHH